ncbi:TIGR01244 family sulfur transferase [Pseudaestuariivita sp.]|uniref:TIGR01244 family sulfur transferase n=1 Tax=Pseudaestuariivita sp. TaxID=2211669 RepID=UPI004058309B
MDIRQITPTYAVTEQITPDDVPAIKDAGFTAVICNRPDAEVPPALSAATLQAAVEGAGLAFHVLPLTHQTMHAENVARHAELAASAPGPVLAYCASGTRSTVVWALGQAGTQPVDDILRQAADGGYNLDGLRPTLEAMAAQKG